MGGQQPNQDDATFYADMVKISKIPNVSTNPHLFAWYYFVSKFTDAIKATWAPSKKAATEAKAADKKSSAPAAPVMNPNASKEDIEKLEKCKAAIVDMKKEKAPKEKIDMAVAELKRLKSICELPAGSAAPAQKAAPAEKKPASGPPAPAMNASASAEDIAALEKCKAAIVEMKKNKAPKGEIDAAVVELKRLKAICEVPAGGAAPAKAAPAKAAPAQQSKKQKASSGPAAPQMNPNASAEDCALLEVQKAKIVKMKADKASKEDIGVAVVELKRLKAICEL